MAHSNLVPGTPVAQLFLRPPNLPRRYGPQQVMSPRAASGCPYGGVALPSTPPTPPVPPPGFAAPRVPFTSLLLIDERINVQRDHEEAQARRLTFEINQGQLYAEREAALRQEVREMQFEHDLSLQASQHLNHWEQGEAAAYQARLNLVENQCSNAATRHLLEVEEQALHQFQRLRGGLAKDEQTYRETVQQEARVYSQSLQQELRYHMNAQAQAESLLAAERQTAQTTLNEQTNQWEAALHQVTEMAEEAVEQERTKTVEAEVNLNVFRLELQESQEELQVWTDWYADLPDLPEAETSEQQEDLHPAAEEHTASLPAVSEIPGASPLTPPVVQHSTLQPRHLPPANLPFSDISARIAAESQRAEEVSQEQEEARRVLQQAELSASQTQLERKRERVSFNMLAAPSNFWKRIRWDPELHLLHPP